MTHEIDFKNPTFDDLADFAKNILQQVAVSDPREQATKVAYFSTTTQVLLGKKSAESADKLAHEIDQARHAVGHGLDKLVISLNNASTASDKAANKMMWATVLLVAGTFALAFATGGLVYYTKQLAATEARPAVAVTPATQTGGVQ